MRFRSTSKFTCQSWTVALLSLLACGLGLAQIGVGAWLWIFSSDFSLVLGMPLRNVFIGYISLGIVVVISCITGIIFALLRNNIGLILYAILLLASIASQSGVWAFTYVEQQNLFEVLEDRIQLRIEYYDFFAREFNCSLQAGFQGPSAAMAVESCANSLNEWTMKTVWTMLGLCAALMCLQFILLVLTAMLYQLVREELKRTSMQISPTPSTPFTETNSVSPYDTDNSEPTPTLHNQNSTSINVDSTLSQNQNSTSVKSTSKQSTAVGSPLSIPSNTSTLHNQNSTSMNVNNTSSRNQHSTSVKGISKQSTSLSSPLSHDPKSKSKNGPRPFLSNQNSVSTNIFTGGSPLSNNQAESSTTDNGPASKTQSTANIQSTRRRNAKPTSSRPINTSKPHSTFNKSSTNIRGHHRGTGRSSTEYEPSAGLPMLPLSHHSQAEQNFETSQKIVRHKSTTIVM